MAIQPNRYSNDRDSQEDINSDNKYSVTGESEFSREVTIPYDQDEVLSERHYTFGDIEEHSKPRIRSREMAPEPIQKNNYRGRGPKGYRRSSEQIKEDVSEALYRSSVVDASHIEVSVANGIVTLKGTVTTREQKRAAENAVENLAGVEDIYNELHLVNESSKTKPSKNGLIDNITGLN